MRPVRVLALSPIPEEGAGCRFRVSQYVPYLALKGFQVTLSPFFTPELFRIVYQRGRYVHKAVLVARQTLRRFWLFTAIRNFDLCLVYREAFPIGPPLIELALSRREGLGLVYDFDDAIFLPNTSLANRIVAPLKYPKKVPTIIRESDHVVAGNRYLGDYARAYNRAVTVIPTCVDTTRFVPRAAHREPPGSRPVIAWIGSPTTVPYLVSLGDVLRRVASSHRFVLRVSGATSPVEFPGVVVENIPWSLEREVSLFNSCDIGIYPLWDDPWAQGKCGFKAIQFMACGVPVVVAAVGVNREIIEDGVNGFLAATETEWVDKLGWLLADPQLREKFGREGRRTVEERYSLTVHAPAVAAVLRSVVETTCSRGPGYR